MAGTLEQKRASASRIRARNRAIVQAVKAQPCTDCGREYPYYIMDLDHVRGKKKMDVALLISNASVDTLLAEIAKCEVVCANCHRQRTHERKNA